MKNVYQSIIIILMLLLFCLADSFGQYEEPPVTVIGMAAGTADFKAGNLQATVGIGLWSKYGGLILQGKKFAEDAPVGNVKLPIWTNKIALAYYGRIVIAKRYICSPYVSIGKGYSEAGMQLMFRANDKLLAGFTAGASERAGRMAGISFMFNFSNQ